MARLASDKVNYSEAGSIAQAIKYQIRAGSCWDDRSAAEKESLDQIATAISRMVVGDGVHWDGIIAYAHAAKDPATIDVERDIRRLAREIPQKNGEA